MTGYSTMSQLQGRTALVTGAAGGVGAATVQLLAEAGARVHGLDINGELLEANDREFRNAGLDTSWSALDVSDERAVGEAVGRVAAAGLDIVVASHGLNSVDDDDIADLDIALFHRIININLGGVLYLAKHSATALRKSPSGVFVSVSSIAAHRAPSGPAYAAAKGGISALSRILSYQMAGDGVRCVTVTPGAIDTQMARRSLEKQGLASVSMPPGSLGRIGQPIEVARLIRFLASDDASYVAGSNVTIDGGLTPF